MMLSKRIAEMAQRAAQRAPVAAAAQAPRTGPSPSAPPPGMLGRVMQGMRGMRFKGGGTVSSGRGDGIAIRGKTKCKMY